MVGRKPFGGKGRKQGDSTSDPIGTCRRSPDGEWMAIMWPSRPSPYMWAVTDYVGSAGYETPERVAHWPIVGAAPGSPAAGMSLTPHPAPPRPESERKRLEGIDEDAECFNPQCGHKAKDHRGGIAMARCVADPATCSCPHFYVRKQAPSLAPVM